MVLSDSEIIVAHRSRSAQGRVHFITTVYCALRELIRAIGREKVIEMFFGRRAVRSC